MEELNKAKIETLPEEHSPSGMVCVTRCRCGDLYCTALLLFEGSMKGVVVGDDYVTLRCAIRKELITRKRPLEMEMKDTIFQR